MAESSMSIKDILAASQREAARYEWKGTFADYLAMVVENPSISKLAHARVRDAILAKGLDVSPDGEQTYRLFENDIFGLEEVLSQVVGYFEAAAKGTETRKRILLLLGPPASGKSTIVALIKQGAGGLHADGRGRRVRAGRLPHAGGPPAPDPGLPPPGVPRSSTASRSRGR